MESEHYPDPFCRELTKAIADRDGVRKDYVLCGNGAADLIFRLVYDKRPQKAIVLAPTFIEYSHALRAVRCQVQEHMLLEEDGFELKEDILGCITENVDMLFLCNPNNPTASVIGRALMETILKKCAQMEVLMVVDECFLELTTNGLGLSHLVEEYDNLFLLRAFTKSYSMAGLRLGYCITSSATILAGMQESAQPWSVSHPAQVAGIEAAKLIDYPARARAVIEKEREFLTRNLLELGLKVFPSSVNYILCKADAVVDLKEKMANKGILIRSCYNYSGLTGEFYRVAVRSRSDNTQLIKTLWEVL